MAEVISPKYRQYNIDAENDATTLAWMADTHRREFAHGGTGLASGGNVIPKSVREARMKSEARSNERHKRHKIKHRSRPGVRPK